MEQVGFVTMLPTLNATLNGIVTVLLVWGFIAIRSRKEQWHKRLMLSAFFVSCLFLTSYVIYHINVGSVPFPGEGWIRYVYFAILIPHVILAVLQLPLILLAINYGLKDQRDRHRKMVRWAYPMWLFVSVTGVIVYLMLYHLY